MKSERTTFRASSGNVFADLGLEDADMLMAKAEIALAIRQRIEELGLNQTQAAELMGTTQARISDLYNAKVMKMTFDRLLCFLKAIGCDAYIHIGTPAEAAKESAGKVVMVAQASR